MNRKKRDQKMSSMGVDKTTSPEDLRKMAGVVGEFPVPIEKIADYLGFSCYLFKPDERTANISGAVNHLKKKIYVNENESAQRQAFTVAHEIGHIVLHGDQDYIDYRDGSNNEKERQADDYAANLLMPADVFIYKWKEFDKNFNKLSNFFGVSKPALGVRAANLGLE